MILILTVATFAQLADLYTWKLLLGRVWIEGDYLYRSVELNPVVNAYPPGGAEILKLAGIVWVLAFASLASSTKRWSILPAAIGVMVALTGIVGTLSNVRAIQ